MASDEVAADMFRAPLARGMRTLDRAFFQKIVALKAARVLDNKNISKIRSQLERSKDVLRQDRLASVCVDPDPEMAKISKKCILLRPEVRGELTTGKGVPAMASIDGDRSAEVTPESTVPWPHSPVIADLLSQELITLVPFTLRLDYHYWTYHDIVSAILPLEALHEIPSGFSQVGHVAHLNLRDEYLPYKYLIAEILMDKNMSVKTVINKIDGVGEENEYRTFRYEVLFGPDDLNVTVSEENCTFAFDYAKVYWNPRLNTEHRRLVDSFTEGEAVCDVCAGVGPFAVPAGKRKCFVWANDLNPNAYAALRHAVELNKVGQYVRPFNADGKEFIRSAAEKLLDDDYEIKIKIKEKQPQKPPNGVKHAATEAKAWRTVKQPKTFNRFILNLPASAVTFLSSFVGLYTPTMREKLPAGTVMPVVHLYCFNTKDELSRVSSLAEQAVVETAGTSETDDKSHSDETGAVEKICAEISEQLDFQMTPGPVGRQGGVEVYDVRDVAPKKRMFCATFRLPEAVAFRLR